MITPGKVTANIDIIGIDQLKLMKEVPVSWNLLSDEDWR